MSKYILLLFWFLIVQRLRMALLIMALYQICIIIIYFLCIKNANYFQISDKTAEKNFSYS